MTTTASERITGIDCDEPDCDYNDPTIALTDYESQIGRECPACGASLLDEVEYAKIKILLEILHIHKTTPRSVSTEGDI